MIVAGLLALVMLFSARFLRQEFATEDKRISHPPAQNAETNKDSDISKSKTPKPVETPPDGTIEELVRTWNHGNAEDIAGLFTSDGTLIIPTGSQIQSRAEIQKTISEKRAGALKATTLTNTVDEVSRPNSETAVVQGTYKIDGIKIFGFSTSATGSYKLRQIKRHGRWFISRAEVTGRDNG
jgi:uncharacterized protein (TIGR02246 family)